MLRSGHVLIVDDDPGVRRVLLRWGQVCGHRVVVAASADEAVEVLRRHAIEVVVCDMRMPGHDGFWLIDHICRSYPRTSIVIATGLSEISPRVTLRAGVAAYLVKPFSLSALDRAIQQALALVPRGSACGAAELAPNPDDEVVEGEVLRVSFGDAQE